MTSHGKALTLVMLSYRKNRHNHRLLFGSPIMRARRGWHREIAAFKAGQIFAYERWSGDKFGTQDWQIFVCKAATRRASLTCIPGTNPGAILLLHTIGKARSKHALAAFDELKGLHKQGLECVPDAHWRALSNAIETGQTGKAMEAIYG